ncbi:unnamed protein product [Rhizopus stolonifer]
MSSSQSQNSLFRQQQRLYRSSIYLSKTKVPTSYTPPVTHEQNHSRKRRASFEDEEMTSEPIIEENFLHLTKRNRLTAKKGLPIGKLLATLDKEKLIELINDLVDSNPHLKTEFETQLNK